MSRILVGVTGKGENTEALRFAARQAMVLHESVTLVHAIRPMLPPPPPSVLLTYNSWETVAHTILADVDDEFRSLTDDAIPVDVVAVQGSPGVSFQDLSRDASLLVLQHRDKSRLYRITTGSTVASVATHAHCPVVSVPASGDNRSDEGIVTVGVHEDGSPGQAVEAAFAYASLHRCSVRVVHAWRLAATYDDMLLHDTRWRSEAHDAITAAVSRPTARYPNVDATIEVRHEWPPDVLAALSRTSDLLVLGRHGRRGRLPERLGSLTRSALSHSHCPVMVVPLS